MGDLITYMQEDTGWRPPTTLPRLSDVKRLGFDLETDKTGPDAKIIGYALATRDARWYLPVGHKGGGNLDQGMVERYIKSELKGKELVCAEAKFEIHKTKAAGIDLEEMGCKVREIQFAAALLDDQRRSFTLNSMAVDFLGEAKVDLDRSLIWHMPSHMVGPYAEIDAQLTVRIDEILEPKIQAEGLGRVLQLENDLIYCTCEMERNGVPLDVEKLNRWHYELVKRHGSIVQEVAAATGLKVNPDSGPDLAKLFKLLNIPFTHTAKGNASFTDDFLAQVDHHLVKQLRLARAFASIDSKFINAYRKVVTEEGLLRYKLHQMKADDEAGHGMFGTISGRYSSSSKNIQQVFDKKRQIKKLGLKDYFVRELFIPRPGRLWVKADAKQIEYRLFAHYSRSERLIKRYQENPELDYHDEVQKILLDYVQIDRQDTKNVNFAKLYCAGIYKVSLMLGVSEERAREIVDKYDEAIPEAKQLAQDAIKLVRKRGYVKTILGRRARFIKVEKISPTGESYEGYDREHSALNRVIQGSAADEMKLKLLEVYNARKEYDFHMFFTVHDEVDLDVADEQAAWQLKRILDRPIPELNLRVPQLWDVEVGSNWADVRKLKQVA